MLIQLNFGRKSLIYILNPMCEVQLAAQPTFEIAAFWTSERHMHKRAPAVNTPTSAQLKGQQLYVKLPANIRRIKKKCYYSNVCVCRLCIQCSLRWLLKVKNSNERRTPKLWCVGWLYSVIWPNLKTWGKWWKTPWVSLNEYYDLRMEC